MIIQQRHMSHGIVTSFVVRCYSYASVIFATHEDPTIASLNLQEHLHILEK